MVRPPATDAGTPIDAGAAPIRRLELSQAVRIDGLFVASDGQMYAAEGFTGTRVFRIAPDGAVEVYASGLQGPIDIADDDEGRLYVTNFGSASVSRISTNRTVETFATVAPFPAGIVRGLDGSFYVAQYGPADAGEGTGDVVQRITPAGEVTTFSSGGRLVAPVGIAQAPDGTIYTANFHNGVVLAIDADGQQTFVADLLSRNQPLGIGHLAFAGEQLLATSLWASAVVSIDIDAERGTRIASEPAANGIAWNLATETVFVAAGQQNNSSLRQINLNPQGL